MNKWNKTLCAYFMGESVSKFKVHLTWCRQAYIGKLSGNMMFWWVNTLMPTQTGRHFADGIFKCIFLNEIVWISIKISLKFVLKGPVNNIPALVQLMAWHRPGEKPLSEPMMLSLLTRLCYPQYTSKVTLKYSYGWTTPGSPFTNMV